jgi:hypothetical protein
LVNGAILLEYLKEKLMIQILNLIQAIGNNMQNIDQAIVFVEKLIQLVESIKTVPAPTSTAVVPPIDSSTPAA